MGRGSACSYTTRWEVGRRAWVIPRRFLGRIHWYGVDLMNWTWLRGAHRAAVPWSVGLMQWDQSDSVGYWSTVQSWQQVQSEWVQSSTTQWFLKTCAVAKQKSKTLIDALDWLSCLEAIQFRNSCRADAWSCMALAKVAGQMHGVACRMQRKSFLVETECWRLQQETMKEASWNIIPGPIRKVIT